MRYFPEPPQLQGAWLKKNPRLPQKNPKIFYFPVYTVPMPKTGSVEGVRKPLPWRSYLALAAGILASLMLLLDLRITLRLDDPANYAAELLELKAGRTEELASALEAVSYQFLSNSLLNETLASYTSDKELYDISRWNAVFSDHLEGVTGTVPEIEDAVFFDLNALGRIPLTMSDSLTRRTWIPVRETILESAAAAEGRPVWAVLSQESPRPAEAKNHGSPLLCARLIKRIPDGFRLGVLVLLIDPDRFSRTVGGFSQDEGISVSKKTDYNLLLDKDGRILASVDPSFSLKTASEAIPDFSFRLEGRLPPAAPGRYRNSSFWVVYNPVPGKDWTILSILPISAKPFPALVRLLLLAILGFSIWIVAAYVRSARKEPSRVEKEFRLPSWWSELSPKEALVLLFLLTGKGNKEIASILGIREQTVKNYLHSAYGRIGAQDRVSAIVRLRDAGLDLESVRLHAEKNPDFSLDPRLFS